MPTTASVFAAKIALIYHRYFSDEIKMPEKKKISTFDDILTSVSSFGYWQILLYLVTCTLVIIPSTLQVIGFVFFAGTPRFHCVTPNVTCEDSKCCENCTEYVFDGPFTSSVSEVRRFYHFFCGYISSRGEAAILSCLSVMPTSPGGGFHVKHNNTRF